MEEGYSFAWGARTTPLLISPSGTQIPLVLNNNVHHMRTGDVEVAAPASFAWIPQPCQAAVAASSLRPRYRNKRASPLDSDEEALPEPETAPILGASLPAAPGSAELEDDAWPEDDQPTADDDDSGLAPGTPIADGPFVPPLLAPAPAPPPEPAADTAGGERLTRMTMRIYQKIWAAGHAGHAGQRHCS